MSETYRNLRIEHTPRVAFFLADSLAEWLRRWFQVPVRKGVGSSPTAVTFRTSGIDGIGDLSVCHRLSLAACRAWGNMLSGELLVKKILSTEHVHGMYLTLVPYY